MSINKITTSDFEMEYFSFGEGKRIFVIIPGMSLKSVMLSFEAIKTLYGDFAKDYTVYVFDRKKDIKPGYGIFDMADDTAKAMKILNISGAYLFGASQGGMIAQGIAIRYPELVKKMILASTLSFQNETSRHTFDLWEALAKDGNAEKLNRDVFSRVYSKEYTDANKNIFAVLEKEGTPEELARFAILTRACGDFDAYDMLDKIKCPTFVIGSKQDNVLSGEASEKIADKLGCRIFMYSGYSHAVYDEAPDYMEKIKSFFN